MHVLCSISKWSMLFGKIIYMHLRANCPRNSKNGIEVLVDQVVFKLWIKTVKIWFWSITQEPFDLLKFKCCFWVPWTIYYKMHIIFWKDVDNFEIEHRTCSFLVRGAVPLKINVTCSFLTMFSRQHHNKYNSYDIAANIILTETCV